MRAFICRNDYNAGANRGLGLGLAKKLVASGRKVMLAARTHEKGVRPLLGHTCVFRNLQCPS